MSDYLSKLNPEQLRAATIIDGPLLIIAGAGSGKTHTLVSRIMHMLDSGIEPESILLLTYTNKAAKEMKDRIIRNIGETAAGVTACTFHSFAANILRVNARMLGISPDYTILDNSDTTAAISIAKENFFSDEKEAGRIYSLKDFPDNKLIASIYSYASNNCISFEDAVMKFSDAKKFKTEILDILDRFKQYKRSRNMLDYEDLLHMFEKFLRTNESFRRALSRRYKYIMVDEYQDTCILQDKILDYLSCEHDNIAVVGDDNQSIYKFRGACIDNILTFEKRHPGCKTAVLNTNYRSSQEILDFSNAMMSFASEGIKKDLKGTFSGEKPFLVVREDSFKEAEFILRKIKESGVPHKDIAVIFRSATQSNILESMLNAEGIPYNKYGGVKFLEKPVVKDFLSFLRLSVNPKDELSAYRLLQLYPGIGKTYAQRISENIAEGKFDEAIESYKKRVFAKYLDELKGVLDGFSNMSLEEIFNFLSDDYYWKTKERSIQLSSASDGAKAEAFSKIKDGREDIGILVSMAKKYKTAAKFLEDITIEINVEKDGGDRLNLTTIHSAKGLEYDTVFVMDCIAGVTPKNCSSEDYPEELRCMYVACTRAKRKLYLMVPMFNVLTHQEGQLSPFINYDSVIETVNINVPYEFLKRMRTDSFVSSVRMGYKFA